MTVWKSIRPGYEVSSDGGVRSINRLDANGRRRQGQLLRQINSGRPPGYKAVDISGKKHLVHRLIAEAFCERVDGKDHVNHKNGNKHDNRAENLEWCTPRENLIHSFRELGRKPSGGERSKRIVAMMPSGENIEFESVAAAARNFDIWPRSVTATANGIYKKFKGIGFKWALQ